MTNMRWTRRGKGTGPSNVLNDRWIVRGHARYWAIDDIMTDTRYPPPVAGGHAYFPSMRVAREEAEQLARGASDQ